MLKKLFNGELPLRVAFWKYGILGLIILYYIHKLVKSFAGEYAYVHNWLNFFRNISVSRVASVNTIGVISYFAILLFLLIYTTGLIKGIWKSSAAYDKSIWWAQLSRLIIVIMSAYIWYTIIRG